MMQILCRKKLDCFIADVIKWQFIIIVGGGDFIVAAPALKHFIFSSCWTPSSISQSSLPASLSSWGSNVLTKSTLSRDTTLSYLSELSSGL